MSSILRFRDVVKSYGRGDHASRAALRGASFELPRGETVSIIGRSGSGKSTLLHLAAAIDLPSAGAVELLGRDVAGMSDSQRTLLRREQIGLVFQFFHLVSYLPVRDNVALPALIAGTPRSECDGRIHELLERVDLADRAGDPVEQLSGGEMQRVAICRALLRRPGLLLADEPTGNLDDATARSVMELMLEMVHEEEGTLLYVTHDRELAGLADRTWELHSGILEQEAAAVAAI